MTSCRKAGRFSPKCQGCCSSWPVPGGLAVQTTLHAACRPLPSLMSPSGQLLPQSTMLPLPRGLHTDRGPQLVDSLSHLPRGLRKCLGSCCEANQLAFWLFPSVVIEAAKTGIFKRDGINRLQKGKASKKKKEKHQISTSAQKENQLQLGFEHTGPT